jgi:SOS-response transcriptional repressor LexA
MTRQRSRYAATADDVLIYVAGHLEAHGGISPSYQNISDALDLRSKSKVDRLMADLGERGLVIRRSNRARCLAFPAPVTVPRAPDGAPLYFARVR